MWIRNAWYVAAWTHEIEPGRIHARTIIDQPLVLYRTTDGIVALEDRCPHRFAPLSLGRLEGDALRCMYHGLKFAPEYESCIGNGTSTSTPPTPSTMPRKPPKSADIE